MPFRPLQGVALLLAVTSCRPDDGKSAAHAVLPMPSAASATLRPSPDARPLVIFLGDSLTAADGVDGDRAWPALVRAALAERGLDIRAVNAGVSGDTTAGGLSRLDWLLDQGPTLMVVALGGNDGLRGLEVDRIEANLRAIVTRIRSSGAEVLLTGQRLPPNYGDAYTDRFAGIFHAIAADLDVELVPFLLAGVGGETELNQADGIHPNSAGHADIAAQMTPYVERVLRSRATP